LVGLVHGGGLGIVALENVRDQDFHLDRVAQPLEKVSRPGVLVKELRSAFSPARRFIEEAASPSTLENT